MEFNKMKSFREGNLGGAAIRLDDHSPQMAEISDGF
jgi:hypothetical protein